MGDGIQAIGKVKRGITDAAYGCATGKVKKVKLEELTGHGSAAQVQYLPQNGPTLWGWGFGGASSSTASSNY